MSSPSTTPARRRLVKSAHRHLDDALQSRRFKDRAWAHRKIAEAKSPLAEARRLADWFRRRAGGSIVEEVETSLDHSNVQELRVKLLRRDHVLDPVHGRSLDHLDRLVVEGGLDRETFTRQAALALSIRAPGLAKDRLLEWEYRRGSLDPHETADAAHATADRARLAALDAAYDAGGDPYGDRELSPPSRPAPASRPSPAEAASAALPVAVPPVRAAAGPADHRPPRP